MQHHDLLAELDGYRNAHASAVRYEDSKLAKAVEAEIARVTEDIKATAEHHELEANAHDGNGQHTLGAQARARAAHLRAAIGAEDAAEKTPRERAVTKKAGS